MDRSEQPVEQIAPVPTLVEQPERKLWTQPNVVSVGLLNKIVQQISLDI